MVGADPRPMGSYVSVACWSPIFGHQWTSRTSANEECVQPKSKLTVPYVQEMPAQESCSETITFRQRIAVPTLLQTLAFSSHEFAGFRILGDGKQKGQKD